jgi:hypothetical protein
MALTVPEFTCELDPNAADSFDWVCQRFLDDANRALVCFIRFRAYRILIPSVVIDEFPEPRTRHGPFTLDLGGRHRECFGRLVDHHPPKKRISTMRRC